jgi:hypothetical protein
MRCACRSCSRAGALAIIEARAPSVFAEQWYCLSPSLQVASASRCVCACCGRFHKPVELWVGSLQALFCGHILFNVCRLSHYLPRVANAGGVVVLVQVVNAALASVESGDAAALDIRCLHTVTHACTHNYITHRTQLHLAALPTVPLACTPTIVRSSLLHVLAWCLLISCRAACVCVWRPRCRGVGPVRHVAHPPLRVEHRGADVLLAHHREGGARRRRRGVVAGCPAARSTDARRGTAAIRRGQRRCVARSCLWTQT